MIQKLIRCLIAACVLVLIGWAILMVLATVAVPALIAVLIKVILILIFVGFVCKEFGLWVP